MGFVDGMRWCGWLQISCQSPKLASICDLLRMNCGLLASKYSIAIHWNNLGLYSITLKISRSGILYFHSRKLHFWSVSSNTIYRHSRKKAESFLTLPFRTPKIFFQGFIRFGWAISMVVARTWMIMICISYICNTYQKWILKTSYSFFFLLNPARPIRPVPKRSIVAGSGTGFGTK